MIENNRVEFISQLNSKLEKEVVGFLNNLEAVTIYIQSPRQDLSFAQLKIYYERNGFN